LPEYSTYVHFAFHIFYDVTLIDLILLRRMWRSISAVCISACDP